MLFININNIAFTLVSIPKDLNKYSLANSKTLIPLAILIIPNNIWSKSPLATEYPIVFNTNYEIC